MLTTSLLAFAFALVATPVLRAAAWRLGFLDRPGPRSSHSVVTARGGGVAVLGATIAAFGLAGGFGGGLRPEVVALLGGALLVATVGLADDRHGLPWLSRLVAHVAAAAIVVRATGGLERAPLPAPLDVSLGPAGPALTVLWVVALVNVYNFMDGIDGLASLQCIVSAAALAWALAGNDPAAAALAAALAGACAGFLPFNWEPASIFLGDVGSGTLGYTLASLALLAPQERQSEAVLLVVASLALFLADATTCLAGRVARGERWVEAHRRHLYQRWVAAGVRHGAVSGCLGGGALVTTGLALAGWWSGTSVWSWAALVLGGGLWALELAAVRRRETTRAEREGLAKDPARQRGR